MVDTKRGCILCRNSDEQHVETVPLRQSHRSKLKVFHALYLFAKACLHVARVSRVLQQAGGHAMLIGVGGSGKQSLAKLAVFMAELAPMTIVISKSYSLNDFKADLQVRIAP